MVTLEVNKIMITWPDDFAVLMMRYYRNNGVSFVIHRNCVHSARPTGREASRSNADETVQLEGNFTYCSVMEK